MQNIEFHSTFSSPRQSSSELGLCSRLTENVYLSPHFELREFTESATARKHGIENEPPAEAVENLKALCNHTLEPLREALGLPIVINSGYRCKALNLLLVNHSVKSQHMEGQAADFLVQGCPSGESAHARNNSNELGSPLAQSQTSKFKVQGESHRERLIRAFRTIILDERIGFDQLIIYPTFIHVSYVRNGKNRGQLTKASGNGKYQALSRAQALALL